LPNGRFLRPLALIPSYTLAVSSSQDLGYQFTNRGIYRVFADRPNPDFSDFIPLPSGATAQRLGHFKAIALDEKRNRLLSVFQAGAAESIIMALDLETNKWSEFSSTGRNEPHSLFYDVDKDRFLLSVSTFGRGLSIGALNPINGDYQTLSDVSLADLDGLTDLYDVGNQSAPYIYITGISRDYISLATDGKDIFSRARAKSTAAPFRRIYVLDLQSGDLKLTYFD